MLARLDLIEAGVIDNLNAEWVLLEIQRDLDTYCDVCLPKQVARVKDERQSPTPNCLIPQAMPRAPADVPSSARTRPVLVRDRVDHSASCAKRLKSDVASLLSKR